MCNGISVYSKVRAKGSSGQTERKLVNVVDADCVDICSLRFADQSKLFARFLDA